MYFQMEKGFNCNNYTFSPTHAKYSQNLVLTTGKFQDIFQNKFDQITKSALSFSKVSETRLTIN